MRSTQEPSTSSTRPPGSRVLSTSPWTYGISPWWKDWQRHPTEKCTVNFTSPPRTRRVESSTLPDQAMDSRRS
eukprot:10819496-Heterocapsa_arctica.AAC.1